MSLKNLKTLRKKMFKKSPASDVWAAVLQNAWALQKLQNWVYFDIFSYFQLFLSSLLMVVPSSVRVKPN